MLLTTPVLPELYCIGFILSLLVSLHIHSHNVHHRRGTDMTEIDIDMKEYLINASPGVITYELKIENLIREL